MSTDSEKFTPEELRTYKKVARILGESEEPTQREPETEKANPQLARKPTPKEIEEDIESILNRNQI